MGITQKTGKHFVKQKTGEFFTTQKTGKFYVKELKIAAPTGEVTHQPSWIWEDGSYILWEDSSTMLTES